MAAASTLKMAAARPCYLPIIKRELQQYGFVSWRQRKTLISIWSHLIRNPGLRPAQLEFLAIEIDTGLVGRERCYRTCLTNNVEENLTRQPDQALSHPPLDHAAYRARI